MYLVFAVFLVVVGCVNCIQFDVPAGKSRCIRDDFSPGQIIHGKYKVTSPVGYGKMNLQILGPPSAFGQTSIVDKDDVGNEEKPFAFTVHEDGFHTFCFVDRPRSATAYASRRVYLDYDEKIIEEKIDDDLLSKDDLTPVEVNLRRVEEIVAGRLTEEFKLFREREVFHRDLNESTNSNIPTFSTITILMLIACAAWQMLYMKNYLKKKKLI